jgi:hypothetical protein
MLVRVLAHYGKKQFNIRGFMPVNVSNLVELEILQAGDTVK